MHASALSLPLLLLAAPLWPAVAQRKPAPVPPPPVRSITQVTIQRQLIIRVPRLPVGRTPISPAAASAPLPPIRWVEGKADACVPLTSLAGAAIAGGNSVDLLLNGGKRLRAKFDKRCPAIGFYSGFYVKMHSDGKVCAARDSIRSRSGGECRIESFRSLVPAR